MKQTKKKSQSWEEKVKFKQKKELFIEKIEKLIERKKSATNCRYTKTMLASDISDKIESDGIHVPSLDTISNWFTPSKKQTPDFIYLQSIACVLDCPVAYFFDEGEEFTATDNSIASELNISPQAVYNLRMNFEEEEQMIFNLLFTSPQFYELIHSLHRYCEEIACPSEILGSRFDSQEGFEKAKLIFPDSPRSYISAIQEERDDYLLLLNAKMKKAIDGIVDTMTQRAVKFYERTELDFSIPADEDTEKENNIGKENETS